MIGTSLLRNYLSHQGSRLTQITRAGQHVSSTSSSLDQHTSSGVFSVLTADDVPGEGNGPKNVGFAGGSVRLIVTTCLCLSVLSGHRRIQYHRAGKTLHKTQVTRIHLT